MRLEQAMCHGNALDSAAQIVNQHRQAVGSIIMKVLRREAETRHLVHGSSVILIATVRITEIEAADRRRMLLDACQLRHVRGSFLVRHIYAVPILLAQNTIYIITVLVAAVVCLRSAHLNLVLQDFCNNTRFRVALIAIIKHPIVDVHASAVHIGDRHT